MKKGSFLVLCVSHSKHLPVLKQSDNNFFQEVLEQIPDLLFVFNSKGEIKYVNSTTKESLAQEKDLRI